MPHLQFIQEALRRFKYYQSLGDQTFNQLTEKDFHFKLDENSNSIAQIVQHMYGNMMSRWSNFLTEDGEKPWRKRDAEFEVMDVTKADLLDFWRTGWQTMYNTLEHLKQEDFNQQITIRNEKLSITDAVIRQVAHYAYHVGQIIFIAKHLKGSDWKTLTIEKGKSKEFNEKMQNKAQ